jgi:probable rRNA maturation factor
MTIPIIQFNFLEPVNLRDRTRLKKFLVTLFKKEGKSLVELQYIFCSDDYLLDINRQYLNHDYYTDIITFDLSDTLNPPAPRQSINAEIYISVDRVRDNAREFSSSLRQELHRVIFHGALHLCGYKDRSPAQEKEMRKMEEKYLELWNVSTWNTRKLK